MTHRRPHLSAPLIRLLRHNIPAAQISGYILAGLIGMAIVVIALQFFSDLNTPLPLSGGDAGAPGRFITLSKKVKPLSAADNGFTPSEIDELRAQSPVRRADRFTASQFNVTGALELAGRGFSTYMFFESVPDSYLDIEPRGWNFNPDDPRAEVPVILPRDYLALYNFGFAPARGYPRISEDIIRALPLSVTISGSGRQIELPARIAGFSSRINTIAVPQSFMQWANGTFAPGEEPLPERLIAEIDADAADRLSDYAAARDYEIAGAEDPSGAVSAILSIVTSITVSVGAVISLLSFFILLLIVRLMLERSAVMLRKLVTLGYSLSDLSRPYCALVCAVNLAVWLLTALLNFIARRQWLGDMREMGLGGASPAFPLLIGLAIAVVLSLLCSVAVVRTMRHIRAPRG